MKSATCSAASRSKAEHFLYLQGFPGPIKVKVLIESGAFFSLINSKVFAKLGMKAITDKRYIVTLGDGSECYTQAYIDVHVSLASELKYLVRFHIIDSSTFDVNLGDDWQRQACVNSGYYNFLKEFLKGSKLMEAGL